MPQGNNPVIAIRPVNFSGLQEPVNLGAPATMVSVGSPGGPVVFANVRGPIIPLLTGIPGSTVGSK